ncbi:WAS/WASL-interacting protein family member 3-like [Coturnix japonica]|uniref:WAS/WASL-interacting protein family member 3-like n=1 Tax=Coturnix japonica TaxID=93934 RepID=UPI0013A5E7AA|nr:WAS/WASL-interacting protein family member 3-like [Coturnix japonica]
MRGFKGEQGKRGAGALALRQHKWAGGFCTSSPAKPINCKLRLQRCHSGAPAVTRGESRVLGRLQGPPPISRRAPAARPRVTGTGPQPAPRRSRLGPLPAGTGLGEGRRRPQEKEVCSPPPPPPPASTAEEQAKPLRGPGAAPRLPPALTCRAAGQHPPARGPPSSGARRKGVRGRVLCGSRRDAPGHLRVWGWPGTVLNLPPPTCPRGWAAGALTPCRAEPRPTRCQPRSGLLCRLRSVRAPWVSLPSGPGPRESSYESKVGRFPPSIANLGATRAAPRAVCSLLPSGQRYGRNRGESGGTSVYFPRSHTDASRWHRGAELLSPVCLEVYHLPCSHSAFLLCCTSLYLREWFFYQFSLPILMFSALPPACSPADSSIPLHFLTHITLVNHWPNLAPLCLWPPPRCPHSVGIHPIPYYRHALDPGRLCHPAATLACLDFPPATAYALKMESPPSCLVPGPAYLASWPHILTLDSITYKV